MNNGKKQRKTVEWGRSRDIKGTFYAKMGTIKNRNFMDLTEEEGIKERWQKYTEELYKKIFLNQITMMV